MTYDIPRNRWGQPLVVPAGGGKPIGYQRATTFAGLLEDTHNITNWKMRQVAAGLASRPDLIMGIKGANGDRKTVDGICEQAMEAAGAGISATIGTALHGLSEQADAGVLDIKTVPEAYRGDMEAYLDVTRGIYWFETETFGVVDELKVAGTWDRIGVCGGKLRIYDVKTGSLEYGMQKIALQLAIYSRATPYSVDALGNPTRGIPNFARSIDQDVATIIHLPAGKGTCELVDVDIDAGWDAVELAAAVKEWRARKDLASRR